MMHHTFFSEEKLKHLLPFVAFCYLVISLLHGSKCQVKGRSSVTDAVALEKLQLKKTSPVTIFRVPLSVRKANDDAYTPRLVSIGPYHHGKEELKTMDELKKMFLNDFLNRSKIAKDIFLGEIKRREKRLRDSYFEPIKMNSTEMDEMILEDAAFILELFYRQLMRKDDSLIGDLFLRARFPNIRHASAVIMDDLLKLENQLPAFILKKLFDRANFTAPSSEIKLDNKVFIGANETISMGKLTYSFFWFNRVLRVNLSVIEEDIDSLRFDHFVDFLRSFHLPRNKTINGDLLKNINTIKVNKVPTVAELKEVGVKFETNESTPFIYDVNFNTKRGVFSMPPFILVGITEIVFRNVIVFEEFHYPGSQYVAQFMKFLNFLVHDPKDVDILDESGILQNWMDNNDVAAALINNIGAETVIYSSKLYYTSTLEELITYSDNQWHGFIETLKKDYFNTPWAAIAFVAASVGVICAILQTTYAIIQSRKKHELLTTFMGLQPPKFESTADPVEAKNWIAYIEKIMDELKCTSQQKVSLATFLLYGEAECWWKQTCKHRIGEMKSIDWIRFKELFFDKYLQESLHELREMELIEHVETAQSSSASVHRPQIMSCYCCTPPGRFCMHYKRKVKQVGACIPFVKRRNIIRNVLMRTRNCPKREESTHKEDPTAIASSSTTVAAMSETSEQADAMMGQKFV